MRLSEVSADKQVVVILPGRFQPFHKGHKAVFDYLSGKYDNVYVATSDKVSPPRSPFNFEEKKMMMELTGMDTTNVVLTKSPYVATEITQHFNKENTILLFAISEKDMAQDPRFTFKPKKDGSPSYFQNAKDGNFETMDKHGYMITVPTFEFSVLGKPMKSATEVRAQFAQGDKTTKQHIIKDLFGNYSDQVFELMNKNITEDISEGGWTDTITQQTKLTPNVVRAALGTTQTFINGFNRYLERDDLGGPVRMGPPTGSSAYYNVDDPGKEYGDIDLSMIAPDEEGMTVNQLSAKYNRLMDQFISDQKPDVIHNQGKPAGGHPIFNIGDDAKVQIDMLWTGAKMSDWSRWRVTPERGVKGLVYGNMYSSLGEVLGMSIQLAGVQLKTINDSPVPFSNRKGTELHTLSTDISTFGVDILKAVYKQVNGTLDNITIDPVLLRNPGLKKQEVKISDLALTIKGLASSFTLNDLYGKFILANYNTEQELLAAFLTQINKKADVARNAPKFNKASTPAELDRVKSIQDQISKGMLIVNSALTESARLGGYRPDDRRVFSGLNGELKTAISSLDELFTSVRNAPAGTKIKQRFLIKFHTIIAKIKQQLTSVEVQENKTYPTLKLGVFANENAKVSIWEHNGTIILVDDSTHRFQEAVDVTTAVNILYDRGYTCKSVCEEAATRIQLKSNQKKN
jgi:hypothetical protein